MLEQNYDNILKLIIYSNEIHKYQITSIKEYLKREKTNSEKWFELIYSILVGTQIKTKKAKFCFEQLLDENFDVLNPRLLKDEDDFSYLKDLIEKSLKASGYRFYKTKSETIFNMIQFFKSYDFNVDNFLNEDYNFKSIRNKLMKIRGIGYKIASHWLRNIGFYIPVIDLHIKNLLYRFKIIDDKKLSYQTFENIQNKIIKKLDIDNFTFDLALWYYGKNFCSSYKCLQCEFQLSCKK